MPKLDSTQLLSIKNFGCFSVNFSDNDTKFFKLGNLYQVGKNLLKQKYDKTKVNITNFFNNRQTKLSEIAISVNPIKSIQSFIKTFYIKKNNNARFHISAFIFRRYKKFCNNQSKNYLSLKSILSKMCTSFSEYNKKKYEEYCSAINLMKNSLQLLPINLSSIIHKCYFWSKMIFINMLMIIVLILGFIWSLFVYLVFVIFNTCTLLLSILFYLIYNIIIHLVAIILYFLCYLLKIICFALEPLIHIYNILKYIVKTIYYTIIFRLICLFGKLPDEDELNRMNQSIKINDGENTYRQLYLINEKIYKEYQDVSGKGPF